MASCCHRTGGSTLKMAAWLTPFLANTWQTAAATKLRGLMSDTLAPGEANRKRV